ELLGAAYGEKAEDLGDLHAAGLRILPREDNSRFPYWSEAPLPSWTTPLLWSKGHSLDSVKYLLTFHPFAELPPAVQKAYLSGTLHLLPFPGSLLFWHVPPYVHLQAQLPMAMQIPLLHLVAHHGGWLGLRVPQSGWLHEPRDGEAKPDEHVGPVHNTFQRNHRWARMFRHEDELAVVARQEKLTDVLFSTMPDDLGLYGKPMARNVQLWTHELHLLLDGPRASGHDIAHTVDALRKGGLFG